MDDWHAHQRWGSHLSHQWGDPEWVDWVLDTVVTRDISWPSPAEIWGGPSIRQAGGEGTMFDLDICVMPIVAPSATTATAATTTATTTKTTKTKTTHPQPPKNWVIRNEEDIGRRSETLHEADQDDSGSAVQQLQLIRTISPCHCEVYCSSRKGICNVTMPSSVQRNVRPHSQYLIIITKDTVPVTVIKQLHSIVCSKSVLLVSTCPYNPRGFRFIPISYGLPLRYHNQQVMC